MNLGILSHIRGLEGYQAHKPIIALSTDVFEDYYDYFIVNGNLFILSVQQIQNLDAPAIYTLTAINPDGIETIFVDNELDVDISTISDVATADFKALAKTLIEGLASGVNNHGIPYTSATVNIMDKVLTINETAKVSGELFSVDNVALDASMFANTGKQGEIYKTKRTIAPLESISAISVPLNAVVYTPMADVCGEDALNAAKNYLKNLRIDKGTPMTNSRAYHKGEHVYVNVETKVNDKATVSKRYYISKIEGNPPMTELPKDDSAWLDITDEVNE